MNPAPVQPPLTALDPDPSCAQVRSESRIVLAARGLRKAFGGQVVLDGVDFELREGEVILLRGDNGSGKTTLINLLTGNLEPDAGTIHFLADGSSREFHFPRRWWQELNPFDHFTPESTAREGIGRMWQDVRLFRSQTLRDNIAVAEPRQLGENPVRALFTPSRCRRQESKIARKADEMLARLGLAGRETSSGDKISLGQSKRVAIARSVAAGTRILFLDEPLAGLDRAGIRDVLSLLESIARDHAVTLVIVEHVFNHPHLHGLITCEWLLANGRISVNGVTATSADKLTTTWAERPPWIRHLVSNEHVIDDEVLPRGARLTRIRRHGQKLHSQHPILSTHDLVVRYGQRTIIGSDEAGQMVGLNLYVRAGEIVIIQAPNGWGKSTLFAAITGVATACKGGIQFQNQRINELPTWERVRAGLRALPSNGYIFPTLKVSEALCLARTPSSPARDSYLATRLCSSLSGGERQRIAWASVTRKDSSARLFLLDEPFNALDERQLNAAVSTLLTEAQPSDGILLLTPTTHHETLP